MASITTLSSPALRTVGTFRVVAEGDLLRVTLPADAGADRLFAAAAGVGAQVRHLRPSVPTLEDVFAGAVGEDRV